MNAKPLDHATCAHLMAYCQHRFSQFQEAADTLEIYVNDMDPEERAYLLNLGWPAVCTRYETEQPEHFALFNQ